MAVDRRPLFLAQERSHALPIGNVTRSSGKGQTARKSRRQVIAKPAIPALFSGKVHEGFSEWNLDRGERVGGSSSAGSGKIDSDLHRIA